MFNKSINAPPPPHGNYVHKYAQLRRLLAMMLCLMLLAGCSGRAASQKEADSAAASEHWPEVIRSEAYRQLALEKAQEYRDKNYSFRMFLSDGPYDPFGDFQNYGQGPNVYRETDRGTFDENGIYIAKYGDSFEYNPVTIAQQGLTLHGCYLYGSCGPEEFLRNADFLIGMMAENGSFPYLFDYPYYVDRENYYKSGWNSAMATGNVLSLFARAYHVTNDEKYSAAAVQAISFLDVPIEEGGTKTTLAALDPSLDGYTILEEYPCTPPTYTLNGYMFTLIGLYDWSQTGAEGADRAKELFDEGIRTLEKILPYYDLGGFTCYDLSHITWGREEPHISAPYHRVHVAFCKIFYDVTGIETFNDYYLLWASYVAA